VRSRREILEEIALVEQGLAEYEFDAADAQFIAEARRRREELNQGLEHGEEDDA
jgi:hypothetical protein